MIQFNLQTRKDLDERIARRTGETKLGEGVVLCSNLDELSEQKGSYVIFGICEDIGVQANYGRPGTHRAWESFLNAFVNVQTHSSLPAEKIILLGYLRVTPDEKITKETPKETLGSIVERIDKKVADLVRRIVSTGNIPIIIGGGHNNAFGNLKGSSLAIGKPINAINIDAHTDLRTTDYRHSGNGFSYALEVKDGPFLNKYAIFGLHQNYTPQYIFDTMDRQKNMKYWMFETMLSDPTIQKEFTEAVNFIKEESFGIELDCDNIKNFPSSAQTPSGFSLEHVRSFMAQLAKQPNCTYVHICEAAPSKKETSQVGKALTYLVTDFIRSYCEHH